MGSKIKWSSSSHFRTSVVRSICLGKPITWFRSKSWCFEAFNGLIVMVMILFSILAISYGHSFLYTRVEPIIWDYEIQKSNLRTECNYFEGKWVSDGSYPLYNASECPFAERGFNCLANGRKDDGYLKWKWKPQNCDIPRFDVNSILENLRGKRVVFVGDSLSRTQWESMICLLMTGVEDKDSVYEVNGNTITKQIRHLGVRFRSFNFTIEFYRSVFLVQPGRLRKRAPKRVKSILELDKLDSMGTEWIDSDILIFNTGHWWTHTKLFDMGRYFEVDGNMKLGMSLTVAYKTALATWASWVENMVDTNRTRVFFRTFEPSHWSTSGRNQRTCEVTDRPLSEGEGREQSSFSDIIMEVVNNITVPVTVMHVTPMGAYRSDAHVGSWSDNPLVPDCSHWCLPGVPDVWNEILFSYFLSAE